VMIAGTFLRPSEWRDGEVLGIQQQRPGDARLA
jgi:hypothetical protein